jgi:hypothetical protein
MAAPIPTDRRPLGYWIDAVGHGLARNLERPLAAAGIDRTAWRVMTVLERGEVNGTELTAALPPDETEIVRPLSLLADLRWADASDGRWRLTTTGRVAHERILLGVSEVRAAVTVGIPPEDYATTLATLEQIVRNLDGAQQAQGADGSSAT